ncbi:hypothetical protein TNCV_3658891 [Trichonephila clavipes]|nr:hypothetical protein TNCV_3658891 [Trichonephila clavipes]
MAAEVSSGERRATVKQHTTQMNQRATNSVFQTTVQRSLLRLVLRRRRLVHAPMLTAVHQQRRLEFSYRYRNWASNERRQLESNDYHANMESMDSGGHAEHHAGSQLFRLLHPTGEICSEVDFD